MNSKDGTAEIVDMDDVRRRRADDGEAASAGEMLKSAREAQGLSLSEAAARTHIKERQLAAIETVDCHALPARPYAIGFVRAYATFLELDASAIVERFKENAGFSCAEPVETEKFEAAERAAPADAPELSLLVVIAILVFIMWCAWQITLPREVRELGSVAPAEAAPVETVARTPVAPPPEIVVGAVLIERIEPIYPMGCVDKAGPVETVVLSLAVTPQGRVAGERVVSATNACFEEAALIAVRRWKFEPMTVDGQVRSAHDQRFTLTFERPL